MILWLRNTLWWQRKTRALCVVSVEGIPSDVQVITQRHRYYLFLRGYGHLTRTDHAHLNFDNVVVGPSSSISFVAGAIGQIQCSGRCLRLLLGGAHVVLGSADIPTPFCVATPPRMVEPRPTDLVQLTTPSSLATPLPNSS